jgi:Ca2+/Na+ antiporter
MSKNADKISMVNSDDKKRYIELYSLKNEATHLSLNVKQKFKNLIVNEECYFATVLVMIILYVVAYWRQWNPAFFIIVFIMVAFEALVLYFLFKAFKEVAKLQKDLSGKVDEVSVKKDEIDITRKDSKSEVTFKREDIRAIYLTKLNIVIMPLAHAEQKAVYLDRKGFPELREALSQHGYDELIKEIK